MSVGIRGTAGARRRPTDLVPGIRLAREAMESASSGITVAWAVAAGLAEAGKIDDSRTVQSAGAALRTATREQLVVVARGEASPRLLAEMSLTAVSRENARVLAAAELQGRQAVARAELNRPTRWERYAVPAGGWLAALIAAGIALFK